MNIDREIDGVDYSGMILENEQPFRDEVIILDEVYGISSLLYQGYKLLNGTLLSLKGKVIQIVDLNSLKSIFNH